MTYVCLRVPYRYRIGPNEVEGALMEHPAVQDAAVVGSPDELRGEVGYITSHSHVDPLRNICRATHVQCVVSTLYCVKAAERVTK